MKYLLMLLSLVLVSCVKTKYQTCLDGYFVSNFDRKDDGVIFCERAAVELEGVIGRSCSDIPGYSSRAIADIRIINGAVSETKCYNRLHE